MDTSAFATELITFLSGFNGLTAYAVILGVLLACGLGVPIPEDITLITAGILAGIGSISLPGALAIGFFGVMAGDAFLFTLGRLYGRRVFKLPGFRRIFTPERILIAEKKVIKNSKFICFVARFLPGLRSPIYLCSGILGVRPLVFYSLDGFAALISVPVWVVGGWWFGQNIEQALNFAKRMQVGLIAGLIILFLGYFAWKIYLRRQKKRLTGIS